MDGQLTFTLLVALIGVALLFDFLNGLHDAANSIATVVSTRVLSPQLAVAWAAFFNFIAFLFFGLHVAKTIGKGIIDADDRHRLGDLRGPDRRDRLERDHLGARHSLVSSHALIGGLLGAGVAKGGIGAVVWSGVIKTTFGIFLAPIARHGRGVAADAARRLAVPAVARPTAPTASSGARNCSPPRSIRSAMAATTPRRRWGSSPSCSIRKGMLERRVPRARSGW